MKRIWYACLYVFLVLYPNPGMLAISIYRTFNHPKDPTAIQGLIAGLPDDPRKIEQLVNKELVKYAVPWQTYGVPWYFASPEETLRLGFGDCQARAMVLMSILQAKGIEAQVQFSVDHMWVTYPHKVENKLENRQVAILGPVGSSKLQLRPPKVFNLKDSARIEKAYAIDSMPMTPKVMIVVGVPLILIWGFLQAFSKRCFGT